MIIPILRVLFRKMWNTKWLTLSTLLGLIVSVAFTTSIPMYADGSLKRVIRQSLIEENQGFPAGAILMRYQMVGADKPDIESLQQVTKYIEEDIPQNINFPVFNYIETLSLRNARILPVDPEQVDASVRRQMSLTTMSDFPEYVEIVHGRMYQDEIQDGVIEAIVLEESLFRHSFQVGDEFTYPIQGAKPLTIKVVGAYQPLPGKHAYDAYWYQGLDSFVNTFMISEKVFKEELMQIRQIPINQANWFYHFDLREIQRSDLTPLSKTLNRLDIELYQRLKDTRVDVSFLKMLDDFKAKSLQLQTLLFTLAAPMIAMVFYYIAMISRQSLDRQRSDIAVLRSRGASTGQIVLLFVLEGLLLGGIAIIIGPFLGWFMAKSIGSASGFLTFVDRQAIPVDVRVATLLYGVIAVLIALAASLIPAIQFARSSIVGLRQQMARSDRKPFWMRWYLDIVLVGLSAYGWYLFYERQMILFQTGLSSEQLQIQPLLFFVPALSIFALGLFFLRIFPLLLRLLIWMGSKFLPVPLYLTFTQLSRSSFAYYPIMLLLILTLGLGVYNASAARTMDLNSIERVKHEYGADVIMQAIWEGYTESRVPSPPVQEEPNPGGEQPGGENPGYSPGQQPGPGGSINPPPKIHFMEPPFQVFKELPGVKHATRVLQTTGNAVVSGKTAGQVWVMGIENVDFAQVAWFERVDLFPKAHPNAYLNLLQVEQAALIPTSFAERYHLQPGDLINVSIEQQSLEFVVAGILPYWPSQYPEKTPFFIANIDYIYDHIPMIPYQVWLKMEEGALVAPLVERLAEQQIYLASVKDVRSELARQEKHPSRGGVFGILSLGFLVSILVSFIGFLLYWFFNLSRRVVQFGVLRAMGLSRRQLTGMLFLEQLFTAGLSIGLGILIGKWMSYLYLPFLQSSSNAMDQVPPFRVVFEAKDTLQLYIVVAIMILAGASLLILHIRRLRVHQAVKLGEER